MVAAATTATLSPSAMQSTTRRHGFVSRKAPTRW
jgi:hypothetical protein